MRGLAPLSLVARMRRSRLPPVILCRLAPPLLLAWTRGRGLAPIILRGLTPATLLWRRHWGLPPPFLPLSLGWAALAPLVLSPATRGWGLTPSILVCSPHRGNCGAMPSLVLAS